MSSVKYSYGHANGTHDDTLRRSTNGDRDVQTQTQLGSSNGGSVHMGLARILMPFVRVFLNESRETRQFLPTSGALMALRNRNQLAIEIWSETSVNY